VGSFFLSLEKQMTEQELIAGCIKQDRRSQNELYKRYFPLMSSIALRYTQNESEALQRMNGGFYRVLKNLEKYDNQYALATWIRNILVNHLIDEFRKEKKYIANIHLTDYEGVNPEVEYNQADLQFDAQELRNMLERLPDVTQRVFNMYALDGFKHREIADYLGISEGTSKWHVSDARKKLKAMLEAQEKVNERTVEIRG
jgi:RNA polymerase sigma factor (sigma-70 family)|tara:strand:+ start:295 stop:894 length:600 start_codon:yes stop_codon:yes gene_type:complete